MTEQTPAKASLKEIQAALRLPSETLKDFSTQWTSLSEDDKDYFRHGVAAERDS
jgi:hypothetical protein